MVTRIAFFFAAFLLSFLVAAVVGAHFHHQRVRDRFDRAVLLVANVLKEPGSRSPRALESACWEGFGWDK